MSKPQHTPGPWGQVDNEIQCADGIVVAHVMFSDDFPGDDEQLEAEERARVDLECDANARLITAAPELLGEVKQLVTELQEATKILRPSYPATAGIFDAAVFRATATLAKATGAA